MLLLIYLSDGMVVSRNNKNIGFGIIILAIIVGALIGFHNLFSLFPATSCGNVSISGVSCSQQINGAITSLSQVQTISNYPGLSGTYWLVSFVLNGQGQYLSSFTSSQLAKAINSSYQVSNNQNINIQAKLNSQSLVIPYTASGTYLRLFKLVPIDFKFGWFSNGAGLGTTYSQTNQTNSSNTYSFAVSGIYADFDAEQIFDTYNNYCVSIGGKTFGIQGSGLFGFISGYSLSCYYVGYDQAAQVYSAGSPSLSENISVSYTNSSGTTTLYLTNSRPEYSKGNLVLAQIVGYLTGSINTYIGTTSPMMLIINKTAKVINPVSSTTIQSLSSIPPSDYQPEGISISGVDFPFIYNQQALQQSINYTNNQVNNILKENLQTSNPFYGGLVSGGNGSPYLYSINVTSNPIYYPQLQLIVNAQTLGIVIPVASPQILSVSPSPVEFRSGSAKTITFTVSNNASVTGSAYIDVFSQNGTLVSQTPDFSIPADGKATEQTIINGYNPSLANLNEGWYAVIYSAEQNQIYHRFNFSVIIQPNCPSGMTYYNNTDCQNEATNNSCATGAYWNGNSCEPICVAPSVFNATTQSCIAPPAETSQAGLGIGWYILAIIVIIVILIYALRRKKSNG